MHFSLSNIIKLIFTIRNFFFAALIGISLAQLQQIEKTEQFAQDFIVLLWIAFTVIILVVRSLRPFVLRIAATVVLFIAIYPRQQLQISTLALIGILLLY